MSAAAASLAAPERLFAFTWLAHLPLALDGERIVEVEHADRAGEDALDLYAVLGLGRGPAEERRAVRVEAAATWLLLGARVELARVSSRAVLPLPAALGGLSRRALVGFVPRADGLFSLFDPQGLLSLRSVAAAAG